MIHAKRMHGVILIIYIIIFILRFLLSFILGFFSHSSREEGESGLGMKMGMKMMRMTPRSGA